MKAGSCSSSNPVKVCQICSSKNLESILFVGYIPPVNSMPDIGSVPEEQPVYPLELLRCKDCTLAQIGLEVDPKVIFPFSYPYLSGSTRILRENFAELYQECAGMFSLGSNDLVIDIGSNDGTLLSNFKEHGHKVLGIEPSQAGDMARRNGIDTLTDYFSLETARNVKKKYGEAKLITAANVFAHIKDIHTVVEGILELLATDGIFVSESHYLMDLVETLQYDTIYHEHLRHYSLGSLQYLLNKHGLEVFHVKRIPTHGGSIRVYTARKGNQTVRNSVPELLALEKRNGISDGIALKTFRERVLRSKLELLALLARLKNDGARIYGIGAPSRSSTLINYTGLDNGIIDAVMEIKTSHKVGKYIPGTRIPVLAEEKLFKDQPEYALLFSWHISKELVKNLRKKGFKGKFIIPLPDPRVITD